VSSEELGDLLMSYWRQWKSYSPVGRGAITQEQYWVLKTLDREGPMKVKDLARSIGCTAGSASVSVKRLEKGGLVIRERSGEDERVVKVSLAKKGGQTLAAWKRDQLKSVTVMFDRLSAPEKGALRDLLVKAGGGAEFPVDRGMRSSGGRAR
jgi:DNA-binding MarR family transcriptional regulator